jgi:hypothetical protein
MWAWRAWRTCWSSRGVDGIAVIGSGGIAGSTVISTEVIVGNGILFDQGLCLLACFVRNVRSRHPPYKRLRLLAFMFTSIGDVS